MARYVREPGEVELLKEMIESARDLRRAQGFVLLTDRRVVLLIPKPSPMRGWLFGQFAPLLRRFAEDVGPLEMTHQIDRDDFAGVEDEGRGMFSFRNKGEGYAHISFAVYSMTPLEIWQQRTQQWVAGMLSAAPLRAARHVDR